MASFSPTVSAQEALRLQSPVLVIDSDQLYANSAFGQRILREIEAEGAKINAENAQIAAELEAEEMALTEQRPSLEPSEFRDLADAFDAKVQGIRRAQETKARNIVQKEDDARRAFGALATPILDQMMQEAGAAVVLERRQVPLFRSAVDITREAIARINAEIGDGATLDESPDPKP